MWKGFKFGFGGCLGVLLALLVACWAYFSMQGATINSKWKRIESQMGPAQQENSN